jgi:putative solute:sodium symporter small subunit
MTLRRRSVAAVKIALDVEHGITLGELRNTIAILLACWIAYFSVIALNIQTLDRVTIPYLDMPLGLALAAQGSLVVFAAALVVLIRRFRQG